MLEGQKCHVRPLMAKDLHDYYHINEDLKRRLEFFVPGHCQSGSFHLFEKKFQQTGLWEEGEGEALIVDKEGKPLGSISYRKCNTFDALVLGYVVFQEENRGKGIMTEALLLFTAYLFATRKINRLQVAIPDYHRASLAVAQKCGYTFEGIAREAVFHRGKNIDLCIYSILRAECENTDLLS